MLRLLPPVCRDCGVSSDTRALSAWLDFKLCSACIAKRERAVAVEAQAKVSANAPDRASGVRVSAEPQPPRKPRKTAAKKPAPKPKPAAKKKSSPRPKKR